MVKPNGRPPKLFSDEKVIELGKDLVDWVEKEGKEEMFFEPWFFRKHNMFRSDWKSLIQRPGFLPYYECARKTLTANLIKNKDIPQSYGNRYIGMYDDQLKEHEAEIRNQTAATNKEQLKELGEFFKAIASKTLASDTKSSIDHKSSEEQ